MEFLESLKRKRIYTTIIVVMIIIAFLTFYYHGIVNTNKKSPYPDYEPYLGYRVSLPSKDFQFTYKDAIKKAIEFVHSEYGIPREDIKVFDVSNITFTIGVKNGWITVLLVNSSMPEPDEHHDKYKLYGEYRIGSITFEARKGRITMLRISYDIVVKLESKADKGRLNLDNTSALKILLDILERFGYEKYEHIGIHIDSIYCDDKIKEASIHFTLLFYGYRVAPPYNATGYVRFLYINNTPIVYRFAFPIEVYSVYEEGLFIKPPDNFPISYEEAYSKAKKYIESQSDVADYKMNYVGIYWYFIVIKKSPKPLMVGWHHPVPHLGYWFTAHIIYNDGIFSIEYIFVDALTGEVYSE